MGRQRESRLSGKIQTALRQRGAFVFKVHGSEMMMAGLPDLVVCHQGVFIGMEVKHPETRGDTSARQRLVHRWIENAGGIIEVVCTVDEALAVLDRVDRSSSASQE